MNINYLVSILNLYLKNENSDKLLEIDFTKIDNQVKVDFSYANSRNHKTYVKIDYKEFFSYIKYLADRIQANLKVEKENYLNKSYTIKFNNQRQVSFNNFNDKELQDIRSNFNNLVINIVNTNNQVVEEVKNDNTYDEIYKDAKQNKLAFSMGFSSFITIFLTAIWFLDVFMIALWIFKSLSR